MLKYFLLAVLFPLSSLAMLHDAYKIVFQQRADKPYTVKIYDTDTKKLILDRELQTGRDLQQVMEDAKNIAVGIYEKTPQGPKNIAGETFNLPAMNLPYTNPKEKVRGFIINIVKDPKTGKIQLVKDLETLVKEAGLQVQSASAATPSPAPVQNPLWKQDKYTVAILNQADKPYTIKIFNRANKQLVSEKEVQLKGQINEQIPVISIIEGKITPTTDISIGVYEKTDQGLKTVTGENINLPDLKLSEFNPATFPNEKGFAIIISKKNGQVQLTKDLDYHVREFGGHSQRASASISAVEPSMEQSQAKYELEAYNGYSSSNIRLELIAKNGNPIFKKTIFPYNQREKWELNASDFPLLLKVDEWRNGKWVDNVFEDEINMPAYNLPKLQFYFTFDTELRLKFVPNIPHGRSMAQQAAPVQPQMRPSPVTQPQAAAASSSMSSAQSASMTGNYEVRLSLGSELPLKMRLVTNKGRTLFDGTIDPKKNKETQLYSVTAQDFPLTVETHDDLGMSFDHTFTLTLQEAIKNSKESREWFAGNPKVKFGKENQFNISISDLRPNRTEGYVEGHKAIHTRARIDAL